MTPANPSVDVASRDQPIAGRPVVPPSARTMLPFLIIGTAAVIVGGFVAAVTGPAGWEHGSWAAAYLVLVVGVGQIGLGAGPPLLAARMPTRSEIGRDAVLYNAGSALVLGGTLATAPVVVTVGGVALIAALAGFARRVGRRHGPTVATYRAYVALIGLLLLTTPIGVALSWARA